MLLIDGYNFLHVLAGRKPTDADRDEFLVTLDSWCRRKGARVRVVFDPTGDLPARSRRGSLEIVGVPPGHKADDAILAVLTSTNDRTAYTVVSDDGEIVRAAERRKARVIHCREFVSMLAEGAEESEKPAEGTDVEGWMREFGLKDDEPPPPAR